jgi:hypothetical protein
MVLCEYSPIDNHINQVTVLNLELTSSTLPPGKELIFDLKNQNQSKKDLFTIKEGVEYKSVFFPVLTSRNR